MSNSIRHRNYGIDLLRIFAMLLIIMHHLFSHGGFYDSVILEKSEIGGELLGYKLISYIAGFGINCFALISGYVGMSASGHSVNNRLYTKRFYKFFQLWVQVLFFSIGLFLLFGPSLSDSDYFPGLIKAVLPVSSKQYWYFSAYVGVFFIAPGLNSVVKHLAEYIGNNKNKKIILFLIIIMICLMWSDPFGFTDGYSFAWLAYLYLIGAMIRVLRIDENISKAFAVSALIITMLTVVLLSHLYGDNLPIDILMERTSPTVLVPSILVVILFSKINIQSSRFRNIIIWISSSVFAVYLLHDNRYFRETFISNHFSIEDIGDVNPMLYMVIVAVLLFAVGILLDKIRLLIFNNKLFMRFGSNV